MSSRLEFLEAEPVRAMELRLPGRFHPAADLHEKAVALPCELIPIQ